MNQSQSLKNKQTKKQIQQGLCIECRFPSKCDYILPDVTVKGSLEDTVQNIIIFLAQYINIFVFICLNKHSPQTIYCPFGNPKANNGDPRKAF